MGLYDDVFGPLVAQEAPDVKGKYYDPAVGFRIGSTLTDWDALVANSKLATSDFAKKYSALTPRLDALADYDVDYLGARLKSLSERQPISDYRDILKTSFGEIRGVQKGLYDQGSAADKLALANLGLSGNDSTYAQLLRANRSAANTVPLYNTALSTAPGVLNSTIADYYQNLQSVPALMAGRYSALENTAGRELVSVAAERSSLASNLDLLNKIGTMHKDAQYFWRRPSDLETYGKIGSNALDTALSVYSGGVSSLGKGGGMGSGSGGGINLGNVSSLFANQGGSAQPQGWNWWSGMNGQPQSVGGYDYMGNWNPNQIGNGGAANGVSTLGGNMNWMNQGGGGGGGGM